MEALFSTQGLLLGTIVPFLFVLTVVVFVHEVKHYLLAAGVRVRPPEESDGPGPEGAAS